MGTSVQIYINTHSEMIQFNVAEIQKRNLMTINQEAMKILEYERRALLGLIESEEIIK